jgi:hypothetical protein
VKDRVHGTDTHHQPVCALPYHKGAGAYLAIVITAVGGDDLHAGTVHVPSTDNRLARGAPRACARVRGARAVCHAGVASARQGDARHSRRHVFARGSLYSSPSRRRPESGARACICAAAAVPRSTRSRRSNSARGHPRARRPRASQNTVRRACGSRRERTRATVPRRRRVGGRVGSARAAVDRRRRTQRDRDARALLTKALRRAGCRAAADANRAIPSLHAALLAPSPRFASTTLFAVPGVAAASLALRTSLEPLHLCVRCASRAIKLGRPETRAHRTTGR